MYHIYIYTIIIIIWLYHKVGIFIFQPQIKPVPPAVEAWSLNPWTAKEVPVELFLICIFQLPDPFAPILKNTA